MRLFVGTTKGLLHFLPRKRSWVLDAVHFSGLPVSMLYQDDTQNLWIALASKHWGPKLHCSSDLGQTWDEKAVPGFPEESMVRSDQPATLKLIWSACYQPGRKRLWLGTEPGGLFYSDDYGDRFTLNQALWQHPSRPDHWFGGGRNEAGIHTVIQDPGQEERLLVGVSCAGVFVTEDSGAQWKAINSGLRAEYLPDPEAKYGHDPHAISICDADPSVVWQQNHCGVFRSTNSGLHWKDVTSEDGYGRYGFCLAIDPENAQRAWIIPAESDEQRIAKDRRLVVLYTDDGGQSWQQLTHGLPQKDCFDLVFRHALDRSGNTMVFGTTTGNLFTSEDDGVHWTHLTGYLPPIHSVLLAT